MLSDEERVERIESTLNQIEEMINAHGENLQELVVQLLELLPNCIRAIEINGKKYGDTEAYSEMTWDLVQVERFFASYARSVGLE